MRYLIYLATPYMVSYNILHHTEIKTRDRLNHSKSTTRALEAREHVSLEIFCRGVGNGPKPKS